MLVRFSHPKFVGKLDTKSATINVPEPLPPRYVIPIVDPPAFMSLELSSKPPGVSCRQMVFTREQVQHYDRMLNPVYLETVYLFKEYT